MTPTTSASFATGRQFHNFPFDAVGNTNSLTTSLRRKSKHNHMLLTRYFPSVANAAVWTGWTGINCAAWQANTTADVGGVGLRSTGVRFANGGTASGWAHFLVNSRQSVLTGGTATPASKGTAGYTRDGTIFLNQRSATPNTLTAGKAAPAAGFTLQMFPFSFDEGDPAASHRWKVTTSRLLPGVVAVAWQANSQSSTADPTAVTLDAAGDVIFTLAEPGGDGWLWTWRKYG